MAAFTARGGVEFDIFDTLIEVGGGAITALSVRIQFGIGIKDNKIYKSGYRTIDIGFDSTRLIGSSSYIAERIALGIWKSRNIWKWVYHFDF